MNNIDYDPEMMEKDEYGNLYPESMCPECGEPLELDRIGFYCSNPFCPWEHVHLNR